MHDESLFLHSLPGSPWFCRRPTTARLGLPRARRGRHSGAGPPMYLRRGAVAPTNHYVGT